MFDCCCCSVVCLPCECYWSGGRSVEVVGARKCYRWEIKGLKGKRCCRGWERGISDKSREGVNIWQQLGKKAGEKVRWRRGRGEQRDKDFARHGDRPRLREGEWRRVSVIAWGWMCQKQKWWCQARLGDRLTIWHFLKPGGPTPRCQDKKRENGMNGGWETRGGLRKKETDLEGDKQRGWGGQSKRRSKGQAAPLFHPNHPEIPHDVLKALGAQVKPKQSFWQVLHHKNTYSMLLWASASGV